MSENEYERPYAIWLKQPMKKKVDHLVSWMKDITHIRVISFSDAVRLLFKAWESFPEEQKKKLLEGD